MIYYRIALWTGQPARWHWKSSPLTSLHPVLGMLNLYRCLPKGRIRVFLSTSPEQMEAMLSRANQGLLSTAITTDQLWDKHCTSWVEVKRLEMELGAGGDHDQAYAWSLSSSGPHVLAWITLLVRVQQGKLQP